MKYAAFILVGTVFLLSCSGDKKSNPILFGNTSTLDSIAGKAQYLSSPFVTAGDRVYVIGFQDGSFPDLGWHIAGEMGGVWDHPIKLMDGFHASVKLKEGGEEFCLDKADQFVNYPMMNKHHFTWKDQSLEIARMQFVPDTTEGVIVEYHIRNLGNEKKHVIFSFTGITDLRPTWLGERTDMQDAEDDVIFDEEISAALAKDKNNPWFVAFGSSLKTDAFSNEHAVCPSSHTGLGKNGTLEFSVSVSPGDVVTIPIFIAGSCQSEGAVKKTFGSLKANGALYLQKKTERFKEIGNRSALRVSDTGIQQMYRWLKYNTDWLVRTVPGQGTGLSAGLPDYPWWFGCDNTYALQGVLATGDHQLVKQTILLLNKISTRTNDNGRIIHEVSTNGAVYNPGNVNETAQFITLVWIYYTWTGDRSLIEQLYPSIQKGIEWLRKEKDPDGNGYPNGSGMMEIPGLDTEMIDVVAYTQQAYASAAKLATELRDNDSAALYQKMADDLKLKINREWWQANDKSFGDFRATVKETNPVVAAALIRADTLGKPWAVKELQDTQAQLKTSRSNESGPRVVYHNWVVNTPLETGIADTDKARKALETVRKYQNPFGIFVTGIDRTEEADSLVLKSRKKIFSYTGAVMTLPTGIEAVSAARYGYPDEALTYIQKLHNSFSYALPGSMYEVSPDFGMVTQAWNIYGVAVPIVNYFFGIQPEAYRKNINLNPQMPSSWKDGSLNHVKVGDNELSITYSNKGDHREIVLKQTLPDWTITLDGRKAKRVMVNGKKVEIDTANGQVVLKGSQNEVEIY